MAKAVKCNLRLHGIRKEILVTGFDSIKSAKQWVNSCWPRPYTVVKLT